MIQVHALNETVTKNLKALREARNLTQEQLATKLDMGVDGYRKWEAGYKQIDLENTILLAVALEMRPTDVFNGLCRGLF